MPWFLVRAPSWIVEFGRQLRPAVVHGGPWGLPGPAAIIKADVRLPWGSMGLRGEIKKRRLQPPHKHEFVFHYHKRRKHLTFVDAYLKSAYAVNQAHFISSDRTRLTGLDTF